MATYTIKDMDDRWWHKVKIMAAIRRMSIKEIIIEHLSNDLKEWSSQVDVKANQVYE